MKATTVTLALIFSVFAASSAIAGDYADLNFIGFSSDGVYMAFEESGEWDGSGGNYATTYFIDVEKNKYAIKPVVFEWEQDSMSAAKKRRLYAGYKQAVAAGLAKLHIVRGNTGKLVAASLLTDWTHTKPIETETYWTTNGKESQKKVPNYEGAFLYTGDATERLIFNPWLYVNNYNTDSYCELTLKTVAARGEKCPEDNALKLELTLDDRTHHRDLPTQVLQKDTDIPAVRKCPYGYHLEKVYFYKDRLAVFINMFSQGFEGPDMRYMAVTGLMEYASVPPGE